MNQIRFKFNAKKAAQAANWLLRHSGGRRNYMELVKLLYLADRRALIDLDSQITGDSLASLPHGTVLSHILNLIRCGPTDAEDAAWFESVSAPIGYDVEAIGNSGESELSGAEVQILEDVFAQFGTYDWKRLSAITHKLPEWTDPNGGSIPISAEQILRFSGKPVQQIEAIRKELFVFRCLDREIATFQPQE
jgi:uncharacterized phage-associated protein